MDFRTEIRVKTGQHQCCLRNGKRRAYLVEGRKFVIRTHHLHRAQINGTHHDMTFPARLHVHLQRGLPVQFDGEVHHVPSLHQAVGRRVRPSSGQVDTHRTAPPHDLVRINRQTGRLPDRTGRAGQHLAHQSESLFFIFPSVFTFQVSHTGTEHRIADARQSVDTLRQRIRQRQAPGGITASHFVQIQLIEHAALIMGSQQRQIPRPERLTLARQAMQIGVR